jgi:hypothetical protein
MHVNKILLGLAIKDFFIFISLSQVGERERHTPTFVQSLFLLSSHLLTEKRISLGSEIW